MILRTLAFAVGSVVALSIIDPALLGEGNDRVAATVDDWLDGVRKDISEPASPVDSVQAEAMVSPPFEVPIEETEIGAVAEPVTNDATTESPAPIEPETSENAGRQHLWSPFSSELSAKGFSNRLSRETGIPLEVIRESPGRYQVAFAYASDEERMRLDKALRDAAGIRGASP